MYCPLPFVQFSTTPGGVYQACCIAKWNGIHNMTVENTSMLEFFNSEYMKQLRHDMIFGHTDLIEDTCSKCIEQESTSGKSRRTGLKNYNIDDDVINNAKSKSDLIPTDLDSLKIKFFGNLCNLKCRMCFASASSKIAAEEVKYGAKRKILVNPWKDMDQEKFFKEFKIILPAVKKLEILGGEPLINSDILKFIKWIVDSNLSKDLVLNLTTNCMEINYELLSYFKSFKEILLTASVDGIGEKDEYIRTGTIWKEKIDNIRNMQSIDNVKLNFGVTLQLLNIGYITDISNFIRDNFNTEVSFDGSILTNPSNLKASNLPSDIASIYLNKYEKNNFVYKNECIKILKTKGDHNLFLSGIQRLKELDMRRGTCLIDIFPEFESYYDAC